jgi:cytochrome c oxidase assembly protein subunit 16
MSREQELGLDKHKKKFDVREEYFVSSRPLCSSLFWFCENRVSFLFFKKNLVLQKLSAASQEEWEPKRIERPKGLPEWGVPPPPPPSSSQQSSSP